MSKKFLIGLPIILLASLSLSWGGEKKEKEEKENEEEKITFRNIKIFNHGKDCPYNDASKDVRESTTEALDHLLTLADANKNECLPLVYEVKEMSKNVTSFFETVKFEAGLDKESELESIKIGCDNYDRALNLELSQYLAHVKLGKRIDETNPFLGMCRDEKTGESNHENFDQCLRDVLAHELYKHQNYCAQYGNLPTRNLTQEFRLRTHKQEVAAINMERGLSKLYSGILNGKCFSPGDATKGILQSLISMGSSMTGVALGGLTGTAVQVSGNTLNFALDYIAKFGDKNLTVRDILKDKNFENSACMFQNLQKSYCEQLDVDIPSKVEKYSCSLRDKKKNYPVMDLLENFARAGELEDYEDGIKAKHKEENDEEKEAKDSTPAYYVDMQNVLAAMKDKRPLPLNKEDLDGVFGDETKLEKPADKSLEEIVDMAIPFYSKNNKKEMNRLLQLKEALAEGQELVALYNHTEGENKFKDRANLLGRMGELLKKINKYNVGPILENYLNAWTFGQEGLTKIMAEEMSVEVFKDVKKKLKTYEGNLDSIRDTIDSAVEQFKPVFIERMAKRFTVNFQNAEKAEAALDNSKFPAGKESALKDRRREVFAWLRDIVKDCLATQGLHFMQRKNVGLTGGLFAGPQLSAILNIDRTPASYLQSCSPFMCEDGSGIPIPKLKNAQSAPHDYQKYSCNLISSQEEIFQKIRDTYLKEGKICGKKIQEIRKAGGTTARLSKMITGGH